MSLENCKWTAHTIAQVDTMCASQTRSHSGTLEQHWSTRATGEVCGRAAGAGAALWRSSKTRYATAAKLRPISIPQRMKCGAEACNLVLKKEFPFGFLTHRICGSPLRLGMSWMPRFTTRLILSIFVLLIVYVRSRQFSYSWVKRNEFFMCLFHAPSITSGANHLQRIVLLSLITWVVCVCAHNIRHRKQTVASE